MQPLVELLQQYQRFGEGSKSLARLGAGDLSRIQDDPQPLKALNDRIQQVTKVAHAYVNHEKLDPQESLQNYELADQVIWGDTEPDFTYQGLQFHRIERAKDAYGPAYEISSAQTHERVGLVTFVPPGEWVADEGIYLVPEHECHVKHIRVEEDQRGQGHGLHILQGLMQHLSHMPHFSAHPNSQVSARLLQRAGMSLGCDIIPYLPPLKRAGPSLLRHSHWARTHTIRRRRCSSAR